MNLYMLENRQGSEDGFKVIRYGKGIVYFDVPHSLASHFIRQGYARVATSQDLDDQRAKENME